MSALFTNTKASLGQLETCFRWIRSIFALRLMTRAILSVSVVVGVIALSFVIWKPSMIRLPWLWGLLFIPIIAIWLIHRSMPRQDALVWYIDKKLHAQELILTAYDHMKQGMTSSNVIRDAEKYLSTVQKSQVRPRLIGREVILLPFMCGVWALVFFWPRPPTEPVQSLPRVQLSQVPELESVEQLALIRSLDRQSIQEMERKIQQLRRALEEGTTVEDAVNQIDRTRTTVEQVRNTESPAQRRAREAALEALAQEPQMAEALAANDLDALTREVEQAAARREQSDRRRAREALERARQAAQREGDQELAESLLRRERLLEERSEQANLARELAEAMPELGNQSMRRALETLEREGNSSELDRAMVDAMREAWQRLSQEERQRLASAMSQAQAARSQVDGQQSQQGGQQSQQASADDVERQLREALKNLDQLQLRVGGRGQNGLPIPQPGNQQGQQANGQGRNGSPSNGQGNNHQGGGPQGSQMGQTSPIDGNDSVIARVRPIERNGIPSQTWYEWTNPNSPQSTPTVSPSTSGVSGESNAVIRARVPEDYREHVHTYFSGE